MSRTGVGAATAATLVLAAALVWLGLFRSGSGDAAPTSTAMPSTVADDLRGPFETHRSGVEVRGTGVVVRILPDDDDGSRHQKFILRMADGLTVPIAHNIDIAPRLDGLRVGDEVEFLGEYEWSAQGGTVHWTHRDPAGRHEDGWLRWQGRTYG